MKWIRCTDQLPDPQKNCEYLLSVTSVDITDYYVRSWRISYIGNFKKDTNTFLVRYDHGYEEVGLHPIETNGSHDWVTHWIEIPIEDEWMNGIK